MAVARQMNRADKGGHKPGDTAASGMQRAVGNAGTGKATNNRGPHASASSTHGEAGLPEVLGNPARVACAGTARASIIRGPSGAQGLQKGPMSNSRAANADLPKRVDNGVHSASGNNTKRKVGQSEGCNNPSRVANPGTTKMRRFQPTGITNPRLKGLSEVSSTCTGVVSAGIRNPSREEKTPIINNHPAAAPEDISSSPTSLPSGQIPKLLGSRDPLSFMCVPEGPGAPTSLATAVLSMSSNSGGLDASETEKQGLSDPPEEPSRAADLLEKAPSPARSTPKLERHFSFEFEEGCLVLADDPVSKPVVAAVAKEKPVKPLRKNLPKVGSPGLKRRLPDKTEGINSIFSGAPDGAKVVGAVGKKSSKVVRGTDGRCGNPGHDRKDGKVECAGNATAKNRTGKPEAMRFVKQVEVDKSDVSNKSSSLGSVRKGAEGQFSALAKSRKGPVEVDRIGVEAGLKSGNIAQEVVRSKESNGGSEFRDADGVDAEGTTGDAANVPYTGEARDASGSPSLDQDIPILVNHDSPVKLVSQDSGIDTREPLEPPRMFPEYFSSLTQAASTPRRCINLVNDYGDVSEDIGLERLCGMVYCNEDDLTPKCELATTFCNYQLQGEFGDVSEDLGFDRFVREPEEGPPAFPGASADSGMFVLDDPYIYDEDYATCNEGEDDEFALNDELMMEVSAVLEAIVRLQGGRMEWSPASFYRPEWLSITQILCANRVNQMTRTYDDVEAMRRLLEEKEKDLELTARIGKELLDRNQELKAQVVSLQAENRSAHESNTQLKHELHQKTQILHALTSDEDDPLGSSGSVVELPSPVESPSSGKGLPLVLGPIGEGKLSARESVARLRRKVDQLEQENKSLRQEATQLASETQLAEETEAILVEGVAQQLASAVDEKRLLENEVMKMRGEDRRVREEMELLLEKLAEAHKEIERLREENAMLSGKVQMTTETQDRLAMELADFKEQYQEVSCLLTEAKENLRKVRQKSLPSALAGAHYLSLPITRHGYYGNHPGDSIASELEISMISEMSLDSGIHMPEAQGRIPHYRKVFETYRSASRTSNSPSPSPLHRMPSTSSLQGASFAQLSTASTLSASSMSTCRVSAKPSTMSNASQPTRGSSFSNEVPKHLYGNLQSTFYSLDSAGQSEESDHSGMATDNEDCLYPGRTRDGVPGSPGAKELQAALNRLDRERQPQLTKGDKAIGGYEGKTRGSSVDVGPHRWSLSSSSASVCQALPYGCRTPDSIMSTGSSRGSRSSWKMPERLMIMKIREGSQFLDEWSRLATPSLSAALEERPGVKVRGRMTDGVQNHSLMDFEEDDVISESSDDTKSVNKDSGPIHPGKFFQSTNSVYTYTNSTVLHPDNTPLVPPSPLPQSPAPSSPSQQPTPLLSRRSSISAATPTFSTALGLAKMLHERGISASSSDSDQGKGHFTSATVTPCNSPDGSPFSSRSPSPEDANPIASLISSGAELLRRSLGGAQKGAGSARGARAGRRANRPPIGSLSRSDRKALAGMKLVEKLERIGLDSLMQYSQPVRTNQGLVPLTSTIQVGSMYARPMAKSPMAQLTSLKSTLRSRSREEPEEGPSPAKQRPKPCRRQDLGTVPTSSRKNAQDTTSVQSHTARGTISAIFFGRKGGLM